MSEREVNKTGNEEATSPATPSAPELSPGVFGKALLLGARNFARDGCFNHSAAISYYALLSVIPFLSLVASILGAFLGSSEEGLAAALERFNMIVPGLGVEMIAYAQSFLDNRTGIGIASGIATLWVSSFVFFAMQTAVGQIFHQRVESLSWRSFALRAMWEYAKPFLMFLSAMTLLVASFLTSNILSILRSAAPELAGGVIDWFEALPSVPVVGSLILSVAMFALVIQVLTERILKWHVLLPAAMVGSIGWEIAKSVISTYLSYASSTLSFTGSAGAIVIFMFWVYYAAAILLYSIQIAAVLSGERS